MQRIADVIDSRKNAEVQVASAQALDLLARRSDQMDFHNCDIASSPTNPHSPDTPNGNHSLDHPRPFFSDITKFKETVKFDSARVSHTSELSEVRRSDDEGDGRTVEDGEESDAETDDQ